MKLFAPKYIQGKTLDLGAGMAKYKKIFAEHLTEYVTCDAFEAEHIDVVADAHNLPFSDAEFDTVICTMVLEHVEKPWIVAGQIERILKPGGHCIAAVPFLYPEHKDPEDYFRYTEAGLRSLFPNCEKMECEGFGGWASVLDGMIYVSMYDHYREKHGFLRRNIYRVFRAICVFLNRILPSPVSTYRSTYFVGQKK
jgi:SAM-dependent methyltransferase